MERKNSHAIARLSVILAVCGVFGFFVGPFFAVDPLALFYDSREITDAVSNVSLVLSAGEMVIALVLCAVWVGRFCKPLWEFSGTHAEQFLEMVSLVVLVPAIVFALYYRSSPWPWIAVAALIFVMAGLKLWLKPEGSEWKDTERRVYVSPVVGAVLILQLISLALSPP